MTFNVRPAVRTSFPPSREDKGGHWPWIPVGREGCDTKGGRKKEMENLLGHGKEIGLSSVGSWK